jgi:hypothetical protein
LISHQYARLSNPGKAAMLNVISFHRFSKSELASLTLQRFLISSNGPDLFPCSIS